MDRLEYELVTLRNNKQYFVLASLMHEYNIYDLVLNVEDENDTKIVLQEAKNGKTIFTDVTDKELLKTCEVYKQIATSQLSEEELKNV